MSTPQEKSISFSEGARTPRAVPGSDSAHYLRQATITLRRRSSWLNQMWCKNRHPGHGSTTWKH